MPLGDEFWRELPDMHREGLTETEWQVLDLLSHGHSVKEVAVMRGRGESTIRDAIHWAGDRIFTGTPWPASEASLGAWCAQHRACCSRVETGGAA